VHICEVDRLWLVLPRLPDDLIRRLRDELIAILWRPIPIPEPNPPPFRFDPGVIDPSPINLARLNKAARVGFDPQPDPPAFRTTLRAAPGSEVMPNPQPLPPREALRNLPLATRSALLSNSLPVVRQALVENLTLIRPWLCLWDWLWPYFYECEEVAVVVTDHQGRFDTTIWYPCFGDHPDLYFWVEYCLGGVWTTVYHPPLRCNTYWNYDCGSEVTLRVTDPRVPWCGDEPPLPGKQLAVLSIGNGVSLTEIRRASAGAAEGLTTAGEPFGGSLEPRVWFGDGLIGSGLTHYRWSVRRLNTSGNPANDLPWRALDHQVIRHYGEEMADSTLTFKPYVLGPDPAFAGQNLFQIRPDDPPLNAGAVSSSWAPEVDARTNTASAYFLSHQENGGDALAGAGKYELKLELFKLAGGVMQVVNLSTEGVLLKVPTIAAPFGQVVVPTQPVAHFPAQAGDQEDRVFRDGTGRIVAFRLVLHVDNNPCYAEIMETEVNGNAAGPCGFIKYTDKANDDAHLSFIARHPHNFATFNFNIAKGSVGVVLNSNGSVDGSGPGINGFVRDVNSLFARDVPVADLLGSCDKAAFSQTLQVDALATDGWGTLEYLDDSATPKAFALEP
jgi:hypothetical protein